MWRRFRASVMGVLWGSLIGVNAQVAKPIKWACIGNSITAGYPDVNLAYAPRLAALLGPQFSIQNDGVSATTLLKKGDLPYWTKGKLDSVFAFKPDIISIKLGTNDTKSYNWAHGSEFVADLSKLVDTLAAMPSHPQIWLCLPCPIFANTYGIADSILTKYIIPDIQQVAAAKRLNIIDVNTPLRSHANLFSDGVHPTAAGSDSLAAIFYRTFIFNDKTTRVACIGNSITQYVGTVSGSQGADSYPSQLNMLLGKTYVTQNYGISGTFMQKQSPLPYWTNGRLPQVFAFKPNVITISLGTNDARATNWNTVRFLTDYRAFIDTLKKSISPTPTLYMCLPMPSWMVNGAWQFDNGTAGNGISNDLIRDSVLPAMKKVAAEKGIATIDLNTPMQDWKSYVVDGVHPNAKGQDTLAQVIYRALTVPVSISKPEYRARESKLKSGSGESAFLVGSEKNYSVDGRMAPPSKPFLHGNPVEPRAGKTALPEAETR